MRVSRRRFMRSTTGLGLTAIGLPLAAGCGRSGAREEPPARVYRLGWLTTINLDRDPTWGSGVFRERLRELGYVEGRTLIIELRHTPVWEHLPALAHELATAGLDAILVEGSPPALRAALATPGDTPIVMVTSALDPVAEGLVESLQRPGGRLTGVTAGPPEVYFRKQLEIFKEAVPTLTRVAILWDPGWWNGPPATNRFFLEVMPLARELGVALLSVEARSPDDLEGAFAAMGAAGVDGMWLWHTSYLNRAAGARIAQLALRHRLPSVTGLRPQVDDGIMLGYAAHLLDTYRRAAEYVDAVLQGTHPRDLPIEHPAKTVLWINAKTARTLGLTIPPSVLARATEVIQ